MLKTTICGGNTQFCLKSSTVENSRNPDARQLQRKSRLLLNGRLLIRLLEEMLAEVKELAYLGYLHLAHYYLKDKMPNEQRESRLTDYCGEALEMTPEEHDKLVQEIIDAEVVELRYIAKIFETNLNRVLKITRESKHIVGKLGNSAEELAYLHDSVRAGIVFLHATLETTLREIYRVWLKNGGDLSEIPLAGYAGHSNRKTTFTMAGLQNHKGKLVDEVIEESIDAYLNTLSFNGKDDITTRLDQMNIHQGAVGSYYSELDKLMKRRHRIVHEGDRIRVKGSHELESIDLDQLFNWINIVHEFCIEVMEIVVGKIFVPKIMNRLQKENIQANEQDVFRAIQIESKFRI